MLPSNEEGANKDGRFAGERKASGCVLGPNVAATVAVWTAEASKDERAAVVTATDMTNMVVASIFGGGASCISGGLSGHRYQCPALTCPLLHFRLK